jgi:patatin-related protein
MCMPENKSREVRFGLVMYGGVSLAIYINGVTHEFARLTRGKGVYKLIKRLTDSDILVDIVSGTSAGGINGIYFAFAMTNDLDFGTMSRLWRDSGDIETLLHQPDLKPASARSLLDSENYLAALRDAFRDMPTYRADASDEPSSIGELDLFVTGTDVDGKIYTVLDDQGHAIDVKDHRSVFWLKHRPGRKEPFQRLPETGAGGAANIAANQETYQALATLARITSCFPAAFRPVHVQNTNTGVDGRLQEWGSLGKESYFLDGGVLDNKPFTHTIRAIFTHPAERPVERILAYVEPDPERFQDREAHDPGFFTAALDGSFGIPGYQSIAEDLRLIAQHNAQVNRYWQVCSELRGKIQPAAGQNALPTGAGIPNNISQAQQVLYGRSRMAALGMRAVQGLATKSDPRFPLTPDERRQIEKLVKRLIEMPAQAAAPGQRPVLTDVNSLSRFDVYFRKRRLYQVAFRIADGMRSADAAVAQTLSGLWARVNIGIQILEIIQYWMEFLMDHLLEGNAENWRVKSPDDVWGDLRWYLEEFMELARAAQLPVDAADLSMYHSRLGTTARAQLARQPGQLNPNFEGLFHDTDAQERNFFSPPEPDVYLKEYDEFVALDALVYPLEFVSNLESTEIIKTLRVSPADAHFGFSNRPVEGKLAGNALAHFGGFFKRSWRSNDILWGRLDAVSEVIEATVTPERMKEIAENEGLRETVRMRFDDPASVRTLFPHSSAQAADEIRGWIRRLLDDDWGTAGAARGEIQAKLDLLAQMEQLEILYESLPTVISDAALEQAHWNRFRVPLGRSGVLTDDQILNWRKARKLSNFGGTAPVRERALCRQLADWTRQDASRVANLWERLAANKQARINWWRAVDPQRGLTNGEIVVREAIAESYRNLCRTDPAPRFLPTRGFVSPSIAVFAADTFGRAIVANWVDDQAARPAESRIGKFFREEYRVGTEGLWRAMPTLLLAEIFTRASLVLRACILGGLDDNTRAAIAERKAFRLIVDWPLRTTYWMSRLWRREPVFLSVFQGAAFVASLITLVLALMGRKQLLWSDGSLILKNWALMIVLPLAVLATQCKMGWRNPLGRAAIIAAEIVAVILVIVFRSEIYAALHLRVLFDALHAATTAFWAKWSSGPTP